MKFILKPGLIALLLLTIVIFQSCGKTPIDHGTEYVLKCQGGSDTSSLRESYNIIERRLEKMGLDGNFEMSMQADEIHVRVRKDAIQDEARLKNLLQSSAGLMFRATYDWGEAGTAINLAQETFLRINQIDFAHAAGTGLSKYLMPAQLSSPSGPAIANCRTKDTAAVNAILRHDSIAPLFPSDLVFHWGKGMTDPNGEETVVLIACKMGRNYEVSGVHVASAEATESPNGGSMQINVTFDETGKEEWAKLTKANVGRAIAIELSDFVYSYPTVNEEITGGQAQITGSFDKKEAEDMVNILNAGALPARLVIVSENTF